MRKKILLLYFIFFLLLSFQGWAQYTSDIQSVSPVTPNEAAMFKPVAQPTGTFSGVVPTDLPLFTPGMPNMPVPVTLSYNSSGFKVEEYASSVGLGWNLAVGGSITRVVHGLADDIHLEGFANHPAYTPSQIHSYDTYSQLEPAFNDSRLGSLDLEPDEFFYACNGLSGKFHFDQNGNVVVENPSGIRITPTFGGSEDQITSWTLSDTRGNVYYFGPGAVDQNSITYSSNNGYANLPANQICNIDWHLQKITDMNGHDMADFYYGQNTHGYSTRLQAYLKIYALGTATCENGEAFNSDETFTSSTAYESVLTSITTPVDKLTIYGDYTRVDDQGGWRIDSIRQTDLNGNLKKMFHFNYDYFYQPGYPAGQDSYYKRLKLLNVSEWGTGRSDSLVHSFGYYTGYNLPSRVSRGQDYWGFYNAQDANWTLMPNGTYPIPGGTVSEGTLGERRPCFPCSEADMLATVTYPTGGTRTFTYEANQYLWDPGSTSTPDQSYFQNPTLYATTDSFNMTYGTIQYQRLFTVNSLSGGTTWNFDIDGCCYYGSYSVTILDQTGHTTIASFSNQLSGSISLGNNTYMLQFKFDVTNCTIYSFNAYWSQLVMPTAAITRFSRSLYQDNMTGPGVRVKQVADYDPVSGQTITTHYQYNLFSDSILSSGLLLTPTNVLTDMSCMSCDYIRLGAGSNYPLSEQGGSYVNYTDVRTFQTGNGRTDRKYSFDFDVPQNGNYAPFLNTLLDNSWRRGQLLSTRYYDNSGNLLRLDSTAYSTVGSNSTWWLNPTTYPDTIRGSNFVQAVTLGYKVHAWIDPQITGQLDYCYDPYYLTSQFLVPDSTVSYIYTPAGTQYEKTAFTYYDSLLHPLLQQDKHFVNDSFVILHDYRYAFNANSAFLLGLSAGDISMKGTLSGFNYFQPLEVTTRKARGVDTSFIEGTHYGFGAFPIFHSTYYYPSLVRHFTTGQNHTDINLVSYDSLGHLAEEYKTGDPHTVWLWGYNYTRPVAKILGSTYTTAMSYVNNPTLQFPSSDNDIRTQVNAVRTGLAGAKTQVTTYTYSTIHGMTSQVDAAGTIIYYDYDNHGRLQDVRDANNNIVKRYTYTINY